MQDVTTATALVHLLGPPRVTLGAATHPFAPDKRHQLLAYLACQGTWVERERLADLLWPDHPPGAGRANLRQLLTLVRGLGWASGLEVEKRRLRWAVDTDLAAFHRAVAAGEWAQALTHYGGPLLDGLDGDGTGEFAAWLDLERGRAHDAWRTALLRRAAELSGQGAHLEAADLLAPLLEGDDLDEEALRARVTALWQAGGHEQALRTHAAFAERLRDELGLEPTAELGALGAALRGGRGPGPDAAGPALPGAVTSFVGRDLELAEIARLFSNPGCRLLTLVGPGGVGKTRLALEAARGEAGASPDGVFFVPLEALGDGALLAPGLADTLGLALRGQADPAEQVARHIGPRHLLLVLDNFEHLLDGAPLLPELLRRCPGLRLLVTSRERLGVEGEWLLPVGGLDYPREGEPVPAEGAHFDAVRLFAERARRVRPDFALTAGNFPHLLRVCRLVGGSPLGLELAAVWVRLLPLAEIAREIGEDLDFLAGERGRSGRHQTLRAVFEHSWRLLSPGEQATLRRLAVFRGGFRRGAARGVAGASLAVLAALVDKSLLRLSPGGRYDRHALISQYTRERLAEQPGEEALAASLHGRYYLSFLMEQARAAQGPGARAALAALDEEMENLRAAWQWAVAGGHAAELERAAPWWVICLVSRARYREGLAHFGEAAAALEGDGHLHPLALGRVLIAQSWFALCLGRSGEARRLAVRGLALVPPGSPEAMHAHNTIGYTAERTGDYPGAERRYRRVLAWAESDGTGGRLAGILPNLAALEAAMGRLDEAARHVEQALALCGRLGLRAGAVDALNVRGVVALAAGQLPEARDSLERGLALARELDLQDFIPDLLRNLAAAACGQGDFGEARRLAGEGLAAARASASLTEEIGLLALLGRASAALGEEGEARTWLGESLRLALAHGEIPRLLEGLVYLAEVWTGQGRAREAASLLDLARRWPAAEYRVKVLARRRLAELNLPPGEAGAPGELGPLAQEALAWLDRPGPPPPA